MSSKESVTDRRSILTFLIGLVFAIIPYFVIGSVIEMISRALYEDTEAYRKHNWPMCLAFFFSGSFNFWIGWLITKSKRRYLSDARPWRFIGAVSFVAIIWAALR
jgi:hypothetical protein